MRKTQKKRKEARSTYRQRRAKRDKTLPKCPNTLETNHVCGGWGKPDTRSMDMTAEHDPEELVSALDEAIPLVSKHQTYMLAEIPASRECPEVPLHSSTSNHNQTKMALSIDTNHPGVSRHSSVVEGSISPFNMASRQDSKPPRFGSYSPPDIHPQVSFQTLLEEANIRAIRARERELEAIWIPFSPEYDLDTETDEVTSGSRSDSSIRMEDLLDSSGDEGVPVH